MEVPVTPARAGKARKRTKHPDKWKANIAKKMRLVMRLFDTITLKLMKRCKDKVFFLGFLQLSITLFIKRDKVVYG